MDQRRSIGRGIERSSEERAGVSYVHTVGVRERMVGGQSYDRRDPMKKTLVCFLVLGLFVTLQIVPLAKTWAGPDPNYVLRTGSGKCSAGDTIDIATVMDFANGSSNPGNNGVV